MLLPTKAACEWNARAQVLLMLNRHVPSLSLPFTLLTSLPHIFYLYLALFLFAFLSFSFSLSSLSPPLFIFSYRYYFSLHTLGDSLIILLVVYILFQEFGSV